MDSPTPRGVRAVQIAFVTTTAILVSLPLLLWQASPVRLAQDSEAASAERPGGRGARAVVERLVSRQLGLRSCAVAGYYRLLYFALRSSAAPSIVTGRDGWLFFNSAEEPSGRARGSIADARRSQPLGRGKLRALVKTIHARDALVSSWQGRYLFVVVPNKSSVYAEKLPPSLTQVGRGKPLEQLATELPAVPAGPLLDLTPALLAAKRNAQVYDRTGSHWNALGALRGLIEIMHALERDYPGLRVPRESDFVYLWRPDVGRELARMLSLAPLLREPRLELTAAPNLTLPAFQRRLRVWVYRDCFFNTLPDVWRAYLPAMHVEYAYAPWSADRLRAERPDVVIELVVERRLRVRHRNLDGEL